MAVETPPDWNHKRGYRIQGDGQSMEYERQDGAYTLTIEGMVNESVPPEAPDSFEYRVWLFDDGGDDVEYPEPFYSKEEAFSRATELMSDYSES